ncbi:MAG: hypothetical protein K2G51_07545 [Lachnospiraceae bacterium]|nr:hypothetical protein [Lachnospiraceae bacterium]MDE7272666.1 hypothetical protein [Lachnospiraceae bacterium]
MGNKTGLITPFFMLLAGAIASIIMYVRGFDLTTMLWVLLVVLVIFYILGDVARYLYASIRPRIIPTGNLELLVQKAKLNGDLTGSVVAFANEEQNDMEGMDADGFMSENAEGYSEEELQDYTAEDSAEQ